MDAVDVIVLDDSDSSSENASASTTPAASPAMKSNQPSTGYQNAVEAALAMAAAYETTDSKKEKKKKGPLVPSLVPGKPKRPVDTKPRDKYTSSDRRQELNRRESGSVVSVRTKEQNSKNENKRPQSSDEERRRAQASRSHSSSRSHSRSRLSNIRPTKPQTSRKSTGVQKKKRRSDGHHSDGFSRRLHVEGRRRTLPKPHAHARSQASVEIVDLLSSSSSSSESSSSSCSRSSSESSSLSSGLSSDAEVVVAKPSSAAKKRLVLNERVTERTVHPPDQSGRLSTGSNRKVAAGKSGTGFSRLKVSSYDDDSTTDEEMAPPRAMQRKRKRVKIQAQRGAVDIKSDKAVRIQMSRKNRPKPGASSVRALQDTTHKSQKDIHRSSSSSLSSFDWSSVRCASPRGSVKATSFPARSSYQDHKPETSSLSRKHSRKSACVSPSRPSPPSTPGSTPNSTPPSRKKRCVYSYFDTDKMALDDLQAQERELAWIQAQHKAQSRPQTSKPAVHTRNTCRDVIYVDDHSDSNTTACSTEPMECDYQGSRTKCGSTEAFYSTVLHPTSFRGVFLNEAPVNILPMTSHTYSQPFEPYCDRPLTFYDTTNSLDRQCTILKDFGKTIPCVSSVFPGEAVKPQADVTSSVSSLISEYLSIIRRCNRGKIRAILTETRRSMTVYRAALAKHHQAQRDQNVNSRLLCRSSGEKYAAKIAKTSTYFCSRNDGSVSFQIGHSISGFLRERSVSALVQINRLKEIQSLRPYTTSIGLRSSYRVEDDPIIKYTADARPGGSNVESTDDEAVKKYGLDIGKVADEEVVEYILRLVVGRLGASEQVFHALKTELGFAQAYTAYSELKKLHDSRERAGARIAKVRKLIQEEGSTGDPSIAALSNLMEHASLSIDSVRTRGGRLQPPISTFESNIVDSVVDSAIVGMAALGLRATDSYNELVDVYRGTFCRMCYQYGCHEHGGEHSLPTRRVDPTYPRVQSVPVAALGGIDDDEDSASDSSDDDTVCLSSDASDEGKSPPEIRSVRVAATRPAPQRLRDPSEFVNASHVSLVATKMRTFLSGGAVCSEKCWKRGRSSGSNRGKASLSPTEVGIVRKLRETMGDNSCLLAAVVGSASCETLHEFVEEEEITSSERPNRRLGNWKHGRRSGGSNHELVQRMRNQRLQDRGTTNHEYKPCMHEGMCDSTGCSCMKRDHMCEKACACSRDCPNRFEGCTCAPGSCRTDACPCFAALRECDPDFCLSCGASNVAVSLLSGAISSPRMIEQCGNVNVACTRHKRLMKSFSDIHGYGMYAHEPIAANEFVYEYTGAMLSQDEAERRGMLYDKMNMSYLFDLNEDAVLDALRSGNKSKFINHEGETPNCTAKVVSVCGIHHISIWALRDIAKGEELVFDYGYKGNVGPEWSKRRSRLETVVSKDPK